MSLDNCCASTGELRRVVEEVAEKAANSAAEKMRLQVQLDLMDMERRLSADLAHTVEEKINRALGMTPQEHIIQHDQMRRTNDFFGGVQTDFWKKIILVLAFGAIAFIGGYAVDYRVTKAVKSDQAITRDEYSYPKKDASYAPNQ
jgi:hypothetical protein